MSVIGREGKPPLFAVFVMTRAGAGVGAGAGAGVGVGVTAGASGTGGQEARAVSVPELCRWQNGSENNGDGKIERGELVVRDLKGNRTPEYLSLMSDMGMPT